jgi:alpha-1,6-mannosyltransferase
MQPQRQKYRSGVAASAANVKTSALFWFGFGATVFGGALLLTARSGCFAYKASVAQYPIPWLVGILGAMGLIYLTLPGLIRTSPAPHGRLLLAWILLIGLAARLVMLPSLPMLEDDHYRYLWDGGVVWEGISPYAHAPGDIGPGHALE